MYHTLVSYQLSTKLLLVNIARARGRSRRGVGGRGGKMETRGDLSLSLGIGAVGLKLSLRCTRQVTCLSQKGVFCPSVWMVACCSFSGESTCILIHMHIYIYVCVMTAYTELCICYVCLRSTALCSDVVSDHFYCYCFDFKLPCARVLGFSTGIQRSYLDTQTNGTPRKLVGTVQDSAQ